MKRKLPWVLLIAFLTIMAAGLLLGEYETVLEKAVTVCLDCIGIG
jgi:Mg/Co/Ni transporter MgtE